MSPSRKYKGPTLVVVTQEAAKQQPYPYVHVNEDGSVRELSPEERSFLETPFTPGDGGRPATKESYSSLNGWGNPRGFCRRDRIPSDIEIMPAEIKDPPTIKNTLKQQLDQARNLGFKVVENSDGSITISRISITDNNS
jgi:hypothetical protein